MNKPIAVIKVGGDVMLAEPQWRGLAENITYLHNNGWQCVILHGGGPQVNELQQRLGLTPKKAAGRRITSPDDLLCVIQAIAGQVNVELTNRLQLWNLPVLGLHGASGIITARKRPPITVSGVDGLVDFGAVGDVTEINRQRLSELLDLGLIPVIATLARDEFGSLYNINADTTVVAIAKALQANVLCMVTAIGGIYADINDPQSLINPVDKEKAYQLIEDGVIQDGMIAKVQEALTVISSGVGEVVITSMAREGNMHSLIEEPNSYRMGTRIVS